MNKEYKNYLRSSEWAEIKIELYNHRGRKCEKCGSKRKLQVHHKTYKNIFKEEPKDLIILCDICHRKEHPGKVKPRKPKRIKRKKKKFKLKIKYKMSRRDRALQKRYDALKKR